MANRFFQQFFFGLNHYPVWIEGSAAIGVDGVTSDLKGSGVKSLTRKAQGIYELRLEDNYNRFLSFAAMFVSPPYGGNLFAGFWPIGVQAVITTVGNMTQESWEASGLPVGVKPAIGVAFATQDAGVNGSTSTVQQVGVSGVYTVELFGDPQASLNPTTPGTVLYFHCLSDAGVAVDPADGSKLYFEVKLRNSSVKGKGE
jgi:hypothetical protein